jgi:signal transduction histidine kinase
LQVLANLIGNAIKFTPEDGSVTVSADHVGDEVVFAVRDSGIGVPAKQLPHVFDRFWQATPKARLGSGLGLTIAKGVVEALHGRIWAESRAGEGTTFFFTLPLAVPETEKGAGASPSVQAQ